ncbi:STAS/SEC14 domain-containing protein [Pseudaestuariivita atlantica]|uniref:STAS/SEC14 domain-containing protein n=1 Tax=Pseudaestuariivita atlantica TaxID=1317121 RepID=A0A0L1JP01_9RHOB|nr:STAS/SEC14 domain-containing protein [Pseudaestuariivita atlantica]KNG93461.1 hypothetical protein ATO11_09520 [Pseudaestuariivita atlantica]
MIAITKPSPNRLNLHISGTLDAETMRKTLDDFIAKSEGVENGTLLYTIPAMAWPTFGAIAVEFARLPELFRLLKHYRKCAVLSDAGWIKTIAELEGAVLPGIEIKGFNLSETKAAEAWLAAPGD